MAARQRFEARSAYPLGSRCRALFRFLILLFSALAILVILYSGIVQYTRSGFLALFLLLGGVVTALFEALVFQRIPRWVAFAMKDSADGFVDDSGLRYRSLLIWHSVRWAEISRIEYFSRDRGRTKVYLFDRSAPIQFGPTNSTEFGDRDCPLGTPAIQLMRDRLSKSGQGRSFIIVDRME